MTLCSIGLPAKQSGVSDSTIRQRDGSRTHSSLRADIDGFESKNAGNHERKVVG